MNKLTLSGALVTLCFFLSSLLHAQTLLVTSAADSGPGSFRQAVTDAAPGNTITFAAALNGQAITLLSEVVVSKALTITGNGAAQTVISGGNTTRILSIANAEGVTINNLTLANGVTPNSGGAILCANTPLTLNNCVISGNKALGTIPGQGGGGIFIFVAEDNEANILTVEGSTITGNQADSAAGSGGGIFCSNASSTINNSAISNNAAATGGGLYNVDALMNLNTNTITANAATGNGANQGGGGIYNAGVLRAFAGNTINNNTAGGTLGSGGGIFCTPGSSMIIGNVTLSENAATLRGGAIADFSANQDVVANAIVHNNTANGQQGCGGGLYVAGGGNVIMAGGQLSNNQASRQGGGLWLGDAGINMSNVTVIGNMALGNADGDGGGAIYSTGALGLRDTAITGNHATGANSSGGGLFIFSGTATFETSGTERKPISGNSAVRSGGGIEVGDANLMLNSCTLSGNTAAGGTANTGNGGGLHAGNSAEITINSSQISMNTAANEGGGLYHSANTILTVTFSDISGNRAGTPTGIGSGNGSGIYTGGGVLTLANSLVSGNSPDSATGKGGGIYINSGVALSNTSTFSGNSSPEDGGAIHLTGGFLVLNAITMTQNTATGNGGGIFNSSANALTIKNSVIQGNTATTGRDLYSNGSAITSNGYNFIGITDSGNYTSAATDVAGTLAAPAVAGLLPLADNGGATFTHAFTCPSALADSGDPADNFGDQRGQMVFNNRRDIGAYEAQQPCSLATENVVAPVAVVYPNPSKNGIFTIALPEGLEDADIAIYELATGKKVLDVQAASEDARADLSAFAEGIYILQVVSEKAVMSYKLVYIH